jgi:large subunit ribosomal protein L35
MPKLKTKKKTAKRFRVTKNGKVIAKKAGNRHLSTDKSPKSKRHMRGNLSVTGKMAEKIKSLIPYA